MRLRVVRGSVVSTWYVVGVTHRLNPFGLFDTTLRVERGTGYVERGMQNIPPYRSEIDPWGADS